MAFQFGAGAVSRLLRVVAIAGVLAPVLSACSGGGIFDGDGTKFSSSEYGVDASPRVSNLFSPPKGGGRYQVGQPYKVRGRWYTPAEDPDYEAVGTASWYGPNFHGRQTANGEVFDQYAITGAHPTLPLPSYVRVTNLDNGRSVLVRINDRGPYTHSRLVDVSHRTAELLGFVEDGTAQVSVHYVSAAPLEGDDTQFLMASLNRTTVFEQMDGPTDLMVASTPPQPAERPTNLGAAIAGIFAYADSVSGPAEGQALIDSSLAAAEAMASNPGALSGWRESVDMAARDVDVDLGVFADLAEAHEIARQFAFLGAVDEIEDASGIRLVVSYLKPGVVREDVEAFASDLGLVAIVRY